MSSTQMKWKEHTSLKTKTTISLILALPLGSEDILNLDE